MTLMCLKDLLLSVGLVNEWFSSPRVFLFQVIMFAISIFWHRISTPDSTRTLQPPALAAIFAPFLLARRMSS